MKNKMLKIFMTILLISTLHSCGGVIGNIEKYQFLVSQDSLTKTMSSVYKKYPSLIKSDTTLYGNNDGKDFYHIVSKNQDTTVFECCIINYDNRESIDLTLTTAADWDQMMELAPSMGFWEKRRYRLLFEEEVLPKIKAELK